MAQVARYFVRQICQRWARSADRRISLASSDDPHDARPASMRITVADPAPTFTTNLFACSAVQYAKRSELNRQRASQSPGWFPPAGPPMSARPPPSGSGRPSAVSPPPIKTRSALGFSGGIWAPHYNPSSADRVLMGPPRSSANDSWPFFGLGLRTELLTRSFCRASQRPSIIGRLILVLTRAPGRPSTPRLART